MANGTSAAAAPATTAASNGLAGPHVLPPGPINRKKQKRREKEAAKKAAEAHKQHAAPGTNGHPPSAPSSLPQHRIPSRQAVPQYAEPDYDEPGYDEEGEYLTDGSYDPDQAAYVTNGHYQTEYAPSPIASSTSKKKKKVSAAPLQTPYHQPMLPRSQHIPQPSHQTGRRPGQKNDRIWNTSTYEERERIREFWLSLAEDERKSLVKIEKEAVLRKMKEQQKHSCSCTVCGRKRTAIEEELEVLYDAYYEELEHAPHARPMITNYPPGHYDTDEGSEEDEEGDPDSSNSELSLEVDYSEEERSLPPPEADFLQFGSSLQVKGGILTVADDLLKNDGKKFIEMMEQLAERRMQREEEAQYQAHPSLYRSQHTHNHPPPEEEEYDDEEDDEEGYEDGDYDEEDEDEDDVMTEEQRMEEGRRMFQIFAARMFEQRVLQAYREKVAAERQQKLLEELAEEDGKKEAKEAKKAKEAQKRKEKKDKAKQAKAEEKARKEAELAAKEAEVNAALERQQEEQRRKKEEQRKKKEASRKAAEEEKQRKEAERLKRQQEERERQQEAERKAREHKLQEKKAKDEVKRKEREEREAKDKEIRESKLQEENERKERETQARAEKERFRKEELAVAAPAAPAPPKKTSNPIPVALPPQLLKQASSTGFPSPQVAPALPKAPTPSRPRQSSQQGSHGSSPKGSHAASGSSKPLSPASQAQATVVPKSILTKQQVPQQPSQAPFTHTPPIPPIGPAPGMPVLPGMVGASMPPGLNGFSGQPMMGNVAGPGRNMPMFPPQPGAPNFRPFPPPGMHAPTPIQMGRGFPMDAPPPGFGPPGFPNSNHVPSSFGMGPSSHSRTTSGTYEKTGESPISAPQAQPIQRPAPIQRPSSVKPHEDSANGVDVDDLANHLGSKALLDDDGDVPEFQEIPRRTSLHQFGSMRGPFGFSDTPGQPRPDLHGPFATSSASSVWGTPSLSSMPFPMPTSSGWGNSPTSNIFASSFSAINPPRVNEQRAPNEQRLVWLRRIVCSTCRMLAMRLPPGADGFIDSAEVHSHIESARGPAEPAVSAQEIKEACDVIGDGHNGGGSLDYREAGPGRLTHIKFSEAGGPPPPLGEIGSPVPGHSVLAGGGGAFGRPFPGLGPQGF